MAKTQKLHCWRISLIRKRGEYLAYAEPPDEANAIQEAIEKYQTNGKAQQKQLVAGPRTTSMSR